MNPADYETRPVIRRRTCLAIPVPAGVSAQAETLTDIRLRSRWATTLGGELPDADAWSRLEAHSRRVDPRDWKREMFLVRDELCPEVMP